MRKPTIRKQLTLWYAGTILLLMVLFFTVLLLTLSPAALLRDNRLLQASARELAGELERDGEWLELDDDLDLPPAIWYTVFDREGDAALSNHPGGWLDELEWGEGGPRRVANGGDSWLVHDSRMLDDGEEIARLRVALRTDSPRETTRELLLLFLILLPVIGLASLWAGMAVARRALAPVDAITETARSISGGDYSRRLRFPDNGDEVARLARTFDEMLDSLQAAFEREKQFTSDASHELRTPLSVILAHTQAALDNPHSGLVEQREALEVIQAKARGMQAMLSQLLLLSRGYEQAEGTEMTRLDLGEMAADIAEEMALAARERGITVRCRAQGEAPVGGDLLLLTRMVMNLVDNAVKYGKSGGEVLVEVRRREERVQLIVSDDGVGIPPEKLPHIFRRFYRGDPARSGEGVGLGLALVEWIVRLHGGSVEAESREGEGSCFVVTLPLDEGITN